MTNSYLSPVQKKRELPSLSKNPLWDIFDEFIRETPFFGSGGLSMPVEVRDNEKNIVVKAEMPGLDKKDIHISLEKNHLIIEGERREEKKEDKENYIHREMSYGSFYRSIPLSSQVKDEKIKAVYKDGILKVTLPKDEKALPKRIAIQD